MAPPPAFFAFISVALVATVAVAQRRCAQASFQVAEERRLRKELEAYAALDFQRAAAAPPQTFARAVCADICATIVEAGAFGTALLLLHTAGSGLRVAGSAGSDDLLERALNDWGERFARSTERPATSAQSSRKSYGVTLGPLDPFAEPGVPPTSAARMCRATVFPLHSSTDALLGALVVAAPRRKDARAQPLESLAGQMARALENATLTERLRRAEKVAGLAHLARGVAHELNNPLTAVVGYAELLADSVPDARHAADAQAILAQAARMRATVASLLEFWQPVTPADEAVDLRAVVAQAANTFRAVARAHGVEIILQLDDDDDATTAQVRGHAERLAEMTDLLLANAVEAVERYAVPTTLSDLRPTEPARAIRITLAREEETLQLVISDTGPGFDDPHRIFDPFYTTRPPTAPDGQAQGLGLALAYGIVREHGGDISALNLHPHGAAVIVELPAARTLTPSGEHVLAAADLPLHSS